MGERQDIANYAEEVQRKFSVTRRYTQQRKGKYSSQDYNTRKAKRCLFSLACWKT